MSTQPTSAELFSQYKASNCQDCFNQLYEQHAAPLLRWLRRRFEFLTREQCEDVAQEAWCYITTSEWQPGRSFIACLKHVARGRVHVLWKSLRRKPVAAFPDLYEPPCHSLTPAEQAIYNEAFRSIRGSQRLIFILIYVNGFTQKQVAYALNLRHWRVKAAVSAIRQKFLRI